MNIRFYGHMTEDNFFKMLFEIEHYQTSVDYIAYDGEHIKGNFVLFKCDEPNYDIIWKFFTPSSENTLFGFYTQKYKSHHFSVLPDENNEPTFVEYKNEKEAARVEDKMFDRFKDVEPNDKYVTIFCAMYNDLYDGFLGRCCTKNQHSKEMIAYFAHLYKYGSECDYSVYVDDYGNYVYVDGNGNPIDYHNNLYEINEYLTYFWEQETHTELYTIGCNEFLLVGYNTPYQT